MSYIFAGPRHGGDYGPYIQVLYIVIFFYSFQFDLAHASFYSLNQLIWMIAPN